MQPGIKGVLEHPKHLPCLRHCIYLHFYMKQLPAQCLRLTESFLHELLLCICGCEEQKLKGWSSRVGLRMDLSMKNHIYSQVSGYGDDSTTHMQAKRVSINCNI